MMGCGIAIFVKTPSLSPVKTRLWPGIGRCQAEALHLLSAEAVASVALQAEGVRPYWAIAETAALNSDAWIDLPHLPQGGGSLGERMARVYRLLRQRHRAALLIGADSPQLTAASLKRAADWLSCLDSRLVLGPARDGGFWLFGGNCPLRDRAWITVRYSAPDTAMEFVRAMRNRGRWLELESLHDVDIADDIPHVLASLTAIDAPTAAQIRLMQWLGALSIPEPCT